MGIHGHDTAALTPEKRFGTLCTGDWVGSTVDLDGFGRYRSHRGSISGPPSQLQVAVPAELSRTNSLNGTKGNNRCLIWQQCLKYSSAL